MTLPNPTRFKNIFVLCTGRCGSQTFSRACEHFTNYTAGHETRSNVLGPNRLAYPDSHVEVDNRLSWMLGRLEQKFGDNAFYVHLTRDASKVAASYDKRWNLRHGIVESYNRAIMMQPVNNDDAAADMVETVAANIKAFLANKSNVIEIDIDEPEEDFRNFVNAIEAEGDIEAAIAEFSVLHNETNGKLNALKGNPWTSPNEVLSAYNTLKSEVESRVAQERSQRLEAQNALIKLNRDYQRFRKWAIVFALPTLLLLMPIWLPFALAAHFRKRKRRRRRKLYNSPIVHTAYQKRHTDGAQAALDYLSAAGSNLPPGTMNLFRAMDSKTDQEWLDRMNAWATARSLPKINLEHGDAPRFHRISFARLEPVSAPYLVTVIVPCFNSEDLVESAVRSILNQSWQNLEVIAVNDASTDATAEILNKLAQEDPRLKVLHNRVNVGPYVSKNRALLEAQGKYVTGHDADDIAIPSRIATQMEPFLADPACKATIGYMVRLDTAGGACHLPKVGSSSFDGICTLASISLMLDKDLLETELGFWDSVRFGSDSEMIARMEGRLGVSLHHTENILMLCRFSTTSLTGNSKYGVGIFSGLSPIRVAYRKSYLAWHKVALKKNLYLPFPLQSRPFEAPEAMLVPISDVLKNMTELRSAHSGRDVQSSLAVNSNSKRQVKMDKVVLPPSTEK